VAEVHFQTNNGILMASKCISGKTVLQYRFRPKRRSRIVLFSQPVYSAQSKSLPHAGPSYWQSLNPPPQIGQSAATWVPSAHRFPSRVPIPERNLSSILETLRQRCLPAPLHRHSRSFIESITTTDPDQNKGIIPTRRHAAGRKASPSKILPDFVNTNGLALDKIPLADREPVVLDGSAHAMLLS